MLGRNTNSFKIVTTSICKIPPNLPLPFGTIIKGRDLLLFGNLFPVLRQAKRGICLRVAASAKAGGGIFQWLCSFNYETVHHSTKTKRFKEYGHWDLGFVSDFLE